MLNLISLSVLFTSHIAEAHMFVQSNTMYALSNADAAQDATHNQHKSLLYSVTIFVHLPYFNIDIAQPVNAPILKSSYQ